MHCPTCGTPLLKAVSYCPSCGQDLRASPISVAHPSPAVGWGEEVIDLSKYRDVHAPREGRHRGMVLVGVLLPLLWIAVALLCYVACLLEGSTPEKEVVLPVMALFSLPIGFGGLIVTLLQKRKKNPPKETATGSLLVFGFFNTVLTALSLLTVFGRAFYSHTGQLAVLIFFALFLITFFIVCFSSATSHGSHVVFTVLISHFISWITASPIAYALASVLAWLESIFILLIVLFILLLCSGGRVLFIHINR